MAEAVYRRSIKVEGILQNNQEVGNLQTEDVHSILAVAIRWNNRVEVHPKMELVSILEAVIPQSNQEEESLDRKSQGLKASISEDFLPSKTRG